MHNDHAQNAMTEIALALAMAFFAIMVLAMVSMGVKGGGVKEGGVKDNITGESEKQSTLESKLSMLELIKPAQKPAPSSKQETATASSLTNDDILTIFHQGQYFDQDLKPLSVEKIQAQANQGKRVILALSPELSMSEALAARTAIEGQNIQITLLTQEWQQAIRSLLP